MNITEALRSRKSVRSFKPDPISKEILREILDVARRSPSTTNTQPWEIMVVTGHVLDKIKQTNVEMLQSGAAQTPEMPLLPYEGKYKQRQVELAVDIFGLMGIARDDKPSRADWMQRGFRFFDAPVGLILTKDKALDESPLSLLDVGAITHAICLAAPSYGLATCIEDQAVLFPEVIRRATDMPASKRIVIAVAIGYPNWDFPANKLTSRREPLENFTTWYGFD